MSGPSVGLCASCAHQRVVRNTRGSSFSLCERSQRDPRFPKYPRIPVLRCEGWEPGDERGADPQARPSSS